MSMEGRGYHDRDIFDLCLGVSVVLLLLHFYYFCGDVFVQWGWMPALSLRVLAVVVRTGFFKSIYFSKLWVLVFLGMSVMGPTVRKVSGVRWKVCLVMIFVGLLIYFGSCVMIFSMERRLELPYMIVNAGAYILMLTGGARMARILRRPWADNDPFGVARTGFPQEERKVVSDFSLHLRGEYVFKGRIRKSWINIINPRRGILIVGSPGSGKSWFIIEPFIRQLMGKGMAMFIYDFKYSSLTALAYRVFLENRKLYPAAAGFYSINFTELSRTHQCNLLRASSMKWSSDALGASRTLLYSLNKTWIHRQGEFFVESPINFVAALIWFLRKYQDGKYCTLPHVIELAQVGYEELFSVLQLEPEVRTLINPFVEAYKDGIMDMLDSQVSSAKVPLGRLASPDVYYVLTGDDCDLDINNPLAPKIFCLGGDPRRHEALAPVLSLFIDQINKQVNQPGKYPCALVCDEFATVRAYSTERTIATARSNNIVPILAVQDVNQLRTQYSKDEADELLDIAGNVFCGQIGGETATRISQRFPKVLQDQRVVATNSHDTSFSHSQQWNETVTPATIATLSSGEFVGIVADDPGKEVDKKAFHARLVREDYQVLANVALPVVREVSEEDVMKVYMGVKKDIEVMIKEEILRMSRDPDLEGLMVRRG